MYVLFPACTAYVVLTRYTYTYTFMLFDLTLLPVWYQYTLIAFLGAVIGSFVNVVVYRMHTGVSINGRSRCFSCGVQLRWFELLPGVSYLVLLGTCRSCKASIPRRDFVAEISLAILFVCIAFATTTLFSMIIAMVLATILLMVMLYDMTHLIIPNEFVLLLASVALGVQGVAWYQTGDMMQFLYAIGASAIAFVSYGSLWKYSNGRWIGLGDAKLAAALGLFLSPVQIFSMIVLSFWVGAAFGITLMLLPVLKNFGKRMYAAVRPSVVFIRSARRGVTMKSELPFAPFIVIAFGLVYACNVVVLDLVSYGFGI